MHLKNVINCFKFDILNVIVVTYKIKYKIRILTIKTKFEISTH